MSDLFMIYEDSLSMVLNKISKIWDSMPNLSKEKTEKALNEAYTNLQEANRILKQMELQIESTKNQQPNNLLVSKVNNYKNKVELSQTQFMKLQSKYFNKESQEALMSVDNYNTGNFTTQRDNNWIENDQTHQVNKEQIDSKKIELVSVGENNEHSISGKDEIFQMNKESFFGRVLNPRNRKIVIIAAFATFLIWFVIGLWKILLL